jgi:elongation factor G
VNGINPYTSKEEQRSPDPGEPLAALAFKIATDPFVGRLVFLRIYSGVLTVRHAGDECSYRQKRQIPRLYQMHANKQNPKDEILGRGYLRSRGTEECKTGDTFCDAKPDIS